MKKTELKTGVEYAVGSPSRYDALRRVKARVIETSGERTRENGTKVCGIVCDADPEELQRMYLRRAFDRTGPREVVFSSARYFDCTWAAFEDRVQAHEERARSHAAERERRAALAADLATELEKLGVDTGRYSSGVRIDVAKGVVTVNLDVFAELVRRIWGAA